MQAVPYPQTHVLGYEQRLGCHLLVVHVGGYVDESGQLLVYRVVGRPYPSLVVVAAVHFDECRVMGRDSVDVSVAILLPLLLMLVKCLPGTLHLAQLLLGGKVASLPVAAQLLVPHEGALLAHAQFVYHALHAREQLGLLLLVGSAGIGECQGRHVVTRAMTLELRGGRVPSVRYGVALGRQSVGVAVVVQLLCHVPREYLAYGEVAVRGEAVVAREAHLVERYRFGHRHVRRHLVSLGAHAHLGCDGVAVGCGVVTRDESLHGVALACGVACCIGLLLLGSQGCIAPAHLTIGLCAVAIGHQQLVGEARSRAHGAAHTHGFHFRDGSLCILCGGTMSCQCQYAGEQEGISQACFHMRMFLCLQSK